MKVSIEPEKVFVEEIEADRCKSRDPDSFAWLLPDRTPVRTISPGVIGVDLYQL